MTYEVFYLTKRLELFCYCIENEKSVDSKTKCNVLVFKSSRFKEESVNFAS